MLDTCDDHAAAESGGKSRYCESRKCPALLTCSDSAEALLHPILFTPKPEAVVKVKDREGTGHKYLARHHSHGKHGRCCFSRCCDKEGSRQKGLQGGEVYFGLPAFSSS